MKQFKDIVVPENLEKLAQKLKKKAELFIVGGYVRNSLLGIGDTDIDIASKLTPDELVELLKDTVYKVRIKNKKLGTVEICVANEVYEHTTFRTEGYDGTGKHVPIEVNFVDDIRQDAKRRDFTINCIYFSITKKKIIDIYSGLYDLKKRRLRTIETPDFVFLSDGLRILRLVRITCELGFKIEKNTLKTAKKMSYRIKDISGTRKQQELLKILFCDKKYSISKKHSQIRALKLLNFLNAFSALYLPVSKIKLRLVKKVNDLRFEALLVDMIDTIDPDCVEYYLDYMLSSKGFDFSAKTKNYLINVVCGYFDAINRLKNRDYFIKYYDNFDKIGKLLAKENIFLFNKYDFFYKYLTNYHVPIRIKDLKITAQDIKKIKPKLNEKNYDEILNSLLIKVFDGEVENDRDKLISEIKNYDITNN